MDFRRAAGWCAAIGRTQYEGEPSKALALAAWVLNSLAVFEAAIRCMCRDVGRMAR
jgi:hypothetical protein